MEPSHERNSVRLPPFPRDFPSLPPSPDGFAFPAASPNGAFYPGATPAASTFGFGFQAGLIYKITEAMNLGLAYTSKQHFGEFEWNSRNDDPAIIGEGISYQATDRFALRAGYNYSDNPIPEENSFFNVAAPAVIQHRLTLGFSFEFHEGVEVSATYYRAFESEVSGPMWHPALGEIPQSNVTSSMFEDSFVMQFSFAHG